jgi:hypothetical protein
MLLFWCGEKHRGKRSVAAVGLERLGGLMRIRRWEEEVEYDRYMRDRCGEGPPAARPARLGKLAARLSAGGRAAREYAAACAGLGLALLREAAGVPPLSPLSSPASAAQAITALPPTPAA